MRTVRLRHAAVAIGIVLGLVGSSGGPPARSTEASNFALEFIGTATTTSGMGYPCLGSSGFLDVSKCPMPTIDTTTTPPDETIPTHARGATVTSSVCLGVATRISDSPFGATPQGPTCALGFTGTVRGFCGFAEGDLFGVITVPSTSAENAEPITITATITITVKAGIWIAAGVAALGLAVWKLFGKGKAVPVPAQTPPGQMQNSCGNHSANNFTLVGTVAGARVG